MSPAQRLEYEKLRLEEEKDRSAHEILARRKAAEEARALKIEEERRRELEQQRITEEMQLQLVSDAGGWGNLIALLELQYTGPPT